MPRLRTTIVSIVGALLFGGMLFAPASSASQSLHVAAVFNVKDFGATGDGVTDDAPAFRDTIAAAKADGGGTVYIPAGTYIMGDRSGEPGAGVLQLVDVVNVDFVGDGPTSIVKHEARDWSTGPDPHLFWCNHCVSVSFSDLTLDGSKDDLGFAGQEQMHGLFFLTSQDVTVERVRFQDLFGDGVYLLGSASEFTEDVVVHDNEFIDNGRSGIGVQSGTRQMEFGSNYFEGTSDQDIDFEPSGGRPGPEDFIINNNTMVHSTGSYSVALGGFDADSQAKRIMFVNNNINSGGLQLFNTEDVLIEGNTIINTGQPPAPTLNIIGEATNTTVRNNILERGSVNGPVVQSSVQNTKRPRDITIELNEIRASGAPGGVLLYQVDGPVAVRDNEIIGSGAGVGINFDLAVDDGLIRHGVDISGNDIRDFDISAIQLHTVGSASFGIVTMCDNTVSQQATGIRLQLAGGPDTLEEAVICNNIWGPEVATPVITSSVTQFRGTGSPEGAVTAPVGSQFVRTDAGDTLYIKESGAGSSNGWVAQ